MDVGLARDRGGKLEGKVSVSPAHPGQAVIFMFYKSDNRRGPYRNTSQLYRWLGPNSKVSWPYGNPSGSGYCKLRAEFEGDSHHQDKTKTSRPVSC